ncbi:MAG: hypothetical protein HF978_14960 [Desulfobacteraceae bacterium]|nr:hypothetical protein [Desulfobacteraceae bacterium]MBC2756840.1 hypothetical protein [Desulfobacteraceae bacterium]
MEVTVKQILKIVVVLTTLVLVACAHIGPKTIPDDRFSYGTAVAESWKQQMLLNIVKLRYMDLAIFMEVAQIVSGYTLETGVNIGGNFSVSGGEDNLSLGGQGRFTDRPTITYMPLTGDKFLRGLLTPIPPRSVFFLLQSGYAADFILGLTLESFNGLSNRSTAAGHLREADPDFFRVLELIRDIQASGAVGVRVEHEKDEPETTVLFFRRENIPVEVQRKIAEAKQLLGLSPGQQRYKLVSSPIRGSEGELSVNSRSIIQILAAFASYVDVPEEHVQEGRAVPSLETGDSPVKVYSGKNKPVDAFGAVQYRGYWFWIDDCDWRSKRAISVIMFFFTLAETGSDNRLPVLTIPAG